MKKLQKRYFKSQLELIRTILDGHLEEQMNGEITWREFCIKVIDALLKELADATL